MGEASLPRTPKHTVIFEPGNPEGFHKCTDTEEEADVTLPAAITNAY